MRHTGKCEVQALFHGRTRRTKTGLRGGETVFCNPPYGRAVGEWVKKAYEESKKPGTLVVCLLPARTDTRWFHDYIIKKAKIRFVRGRLKFGDGKAPAPFPSMVVIFENGEDT